ncbi:hypothetical protein J7E52_09865 [Bacillus sp. ISL-34]|uniref:hypothetical protein n=1 Tax=Bacillus sp. ISL-34 TaxID=2819121 RepID=UPI001BEAEF2F|nr:hypothetical protein [Bacillus sp. ISL-34]MBT2647020.1 hypothetical protein [Bacillus sp. ISL-34]
MNWLRIICALIGISIYLYLIFQTSRFSKEFKKAINDDRSISKRFVHKWDRKYSKEAILLIIGSIFGIIAIFLS